MVFCLVLQADLDRIETTFRDLTSGTGELNYTSFKRDVFANFLPEKLATVSFYFWFKIPLCISVNCLHS